MSREVKEMIARNNELRKQLNEENQKYYEDMLVYIRLASFFQDDKEIEPVLLNILSDMLEAQADGLSAEHYFGKNPKESAELLLEEIGWKWKPALKTIGFTVGIALLIQGIIQVLMMGGKLHLPAIFLSVILTVLGTGMILLLLKKTVYSTNKWSSASTYLLYFVILTATIGLIGLSYIFIPRIWDLVIPTNWLLGLMGVLALLLLTNTVQTIRSPYSDKNLVGPFLPVLWGILIVGFFATFPLTSEWMHSTKGAILVGVILFGSQILSLYFTKWLVKD